MIYDQALTIEQRLAVALRLIRTGRYSTPGLAETLGVSIPTASRCVAVLRDRGHAIESRKSAAGWRYVLTKQGRIPFSHGDPASTIGTAAEPGRV